MAVQIASKRQRRNQSCFGSVYFFVCLLNSFERVPVPTVTQKPYGSNESNVGMPMLRSEFSIDVYLFSTMRMVLWLFEFKMKTQGAWIISHRNIVAPTHQTGWKWTRTAKPTQCNKKFSKKCCASMKKHEFWSPASTFQWCFYGGNYIGIFWGSSIELDRPDGEATFSRLHKASTRYYALFRLLRASAVQKV